MFTDKLFLESTITVKCCRGILRGSMPTDFFDLIWFRSAIFENFNIFVFLKILMQFMAKC